MNVFSFLWQHAFDLAHWWVWAVGSVFAINEISEWLFHRSIAILRTHGRHVAIGLLLTAQLVAAYRSATDRRLLQQQNASLESDARVLKERFQHQGPPLRAPSIDVAHYDPVIRADQNWQAIIKDRYNPDFELRVQLNAGNFRVEMKNRLGEDRTSARRPINIQGTSPNVFRP